MDSQFMDPWIMIIPQNPKYPVYILLKCITTNVFNRLSLQQQPLSTVIFVAKITAFAAAVKNERRELHRLGPCLVNMAAGESEKKQFLGFTGGFLLDLHPQKIRKNTEKPSQ